MELFLGCSLLHALHIQRKTKMCIEKDHYSAKNGSKMEQRTLK